MRVHEFVDEGLGHSSYVVEVGRRALFIDPPRFPTPHEQLVHRLSVAVAWTADTHSHADYVTGSPSFAARSGATFLAPSASELQVPHQPLTDDDVVDLDDGYTLRAMATPGHTPDHMAYLLCCDGAPVALFSGGSLMVGTVGRTDLLGSQLAEPLAHQMFQSLRRLDVLPDDLAVYPTHGAGSFCGAPGSSARTTTIGTERAGNPLFVIDSEDEFVNTLLDGFGTFPSYFGRLPELNRLGPTHYDQLPSLRGLSTNEVVAHVAEGALIVDARPMKQFATGHIAGSMSNTLRPVFASWIGWLTEPGQPLVFVLDPDQDRGDLVRQCLDVGAENLLGELDGGIDAWRDTGRPLTQIRVVDAASMTPTIIDVRQGNEYQSGHVPDSVNVELGSIPDVTPFTDPLTVMCGHGERAMTAASILAANGTPEVSVFDGGPDTWAVATGLELHVGK